MLLVSNYVLINVRVYCLLSRLWNRSFDGFVTLRIGWVRATFVCVKCYIIEDGRKEAIRGQKLNYRVTSILSEY